MRILNLFKKKKTPVEVLKQKLSKGFNDVVKGTLKNKRGDPLMDNLLLKVAITKFYQSMKTNSQLNIYCIMTGIDYQAILDEECNKVLNTWLPPTTKQHVDDNYRDFLTDTKETVQTVSSPKPISKWSVKSVRDFNAEEIDAVSQAVVVSSEYGNSVQFTMKSGGMTYIPLDQNSNLTTGEIIDLSKAKLICLEKSGESDIYRVGYQESPW